LAERLWSDASGLFFWRKRGHFGVKRALFRAKKGQNQGFAVTDSLTERKCKLLISCKLQGIKTSKNDFHR
jgi:hypothetical protein